MRISAGIALGMLLLSAPSFAKITCTNTWDTGTALSLTVSTSVILPTIKLLSPGFASCESDPEACTELPCNISEAPDCWDVQIGGCYKYLVSQCGTFSPIIRQLALQSATPCNN